MFKKKSEEFHSKTGNYGSSEQCKFYNLKKTLNEKLSRFNSKFNTVEQRPGRYISRNYPISAQTEKIYRKKNVRGKWGIVKRTQSPKRGKRIGKKNYLKIIWQKIFQKLLSNQGYFKTDIRHRATDTRNSTNCKTDKYRI